MPTGACGINCDVCKLKLLEICSSCGPGKSMQAQRKLGAQKRILGSPCPILACAALNNLDYCLRDCSSFPCENFSAGPYPFSQGFLDMQMRRRQETPPALTHNRTPIEVPSEYWDKLESSELNQLCNLTLFDLHPEGGLVFRFLHEQIWIDLENRSLQRFQNGSWEPAEDPLLELVTLLYLNNVRSVCPLGKEIVGPQELKEAHYFKGIHALNLDPLLERYGNDLEGFKKSARYLKGEPMEMADAAYRLFPFPRVPLYYLLWEGDEEFGPKVSVLFDRSIENIFSASGIWALVTLVSRILLKGPEAHFAFSC